MRPFLAPLVLACGLALAGCATPPPASDPEAVAEFRQDNDPAEPFNRTMYSIHQGVDEYVLRPVAKAWRYVVPEPARLAVRNVLVNLRSPVVLMNDVLQGETQRAGNTMGRFLINSTLGLGGMLDVARDHFALPPHYEDFGQTFAVWGAGEGPYLFIPVLGPTNPRDLLGFGVGIVADPFFWIGQGAVVDALYGARTGATVVDTREGLLDPLDELQRTSMDPYSSLRSAFRQRRNAEIGNRLDGGTPLGAGIGARPR